MRLMHDLLFFPAKQMMSFINYLYDFKQKYCLCCVHISQFFPLIKCCDIQLHLAVYNGSKHVFKCVLLANISAVQDGHFVKCFLARFVVLIHLIQLHFIFL